MYAVRQEFSNCGLKRKPNDECGSLSGRALKREGALVLFYDGSIGQRQSLANSFTDFFGGEERLEYFCLYFQLDAWSVVDHPDFCPAVFVPCGNLDDAFVH